LSLGAWRMGLGCSCKILPPSPPPSSPTVVFFSKKKTGILSIYVFVTKGVHIKDGELPGTSYEAEFRCGYIRFVER